MPRVDLFMAGRQGAKGDVWAQNRCSAKALRYLLHIRCAFNIQPGDADR